MFADNGDARIAGAATPGPARRVEGGLRVSGRWAYASGSPHATWAGVIAMFTDESGQPGDAYWCLVPASDLRLEDTWRTTGMRGTGSNTWVGEDVFVPDYRTILMDAVSKEALPAPSDSPMYRLPFPTLATLALLGPILGVASAALTYTIEKAPTKTMHHTIFTNQSDSVGVQVQIAEAALKLETARLHMYAVADQLDRAAVDERHIDYDERAKARAQGGSRRSRCSMRSTSSSTCTARVVSPNPPTTTVLARRQHRRAACGSLSRRRIRDIREVVARRRRPDQPDGVTRRRDYGF